MRWSSHGLHLCIKGTDFLLCLIIWISFQQLCMSGRRNCWFAVTGAEGCRGVRSNNWLAESSAWCSESSSNEYKLTLIKYLLGLRHFRLSSPHSRRRSSAGAELLSKAEDKHLNRRIVIVILPFFSSPPPQLILMKWSCESNCWRETIATACLWGCIGQMSCGH